jgi:hypothetical protein
MATLVQLVRTGRDSSPWRLVVTCQTSEWPRLLGRLAELNAAVSWRSVNLGDLSDEELREVARRFPRTAPLTLRPGLREVIRSPKLLDVLIGLRPDESGPDEVYSLTGESDLADCFWERMVRRSEQADSRVRYAVCP